MHIVGVKLAAQDSGAGAQEVGPGHDGQPPQDGRPVTGRGQGELAVLGYAARGHAAPVLPAQHHISLRSL